MPSLPETALLFRPLNISMVGVNFISRTFQKWHNSVLSSTNPEFDAELINVLHFLIRTSWKSWEEFEIMALEVLHLIWGLPEKGPGRGPGMPGKRARLADLHEFSGNPIFFAKLEGAQVTSSGFQELENS